MSKSLPSLPVRNLLGPAICSIRESKGWSQEDLARRLQLAGWDVDRSLIARIELRTRCLTDVELLTIARCLKVGLDAFASFAASAGKHARRR
jgi:transcriptional regulator with XRE-family HTH domain